MTVSVLRERGAKVADLRFSHVVGMNRRARWAWHSTTIHTWCQDSSHRKNNTNFLTLCMTLSGQVFAAYMIYSFSIGFSESLDFRLMKIYLNSSCMRLDKL